MVLALGHGNHPTAASAAESKLMPNVCHLMGAGYSYDMWENRRLRDISEADLRELVNSELEEHLQLEYKSSLYGNNHEGSRESLLDICMFANGGGGILLIGIAEQRDADGQPTGIPDPNADLGIDLPNPEMVLQSYDARVIANIQDRLPLESYAIPVANNRHVIAIRVPDSMSKPHRVYYQGHAYFPSRRERHRYEMDIREIKEMVMRTASRLEISEGKLGEALHSFQRQNDLPYLLVGCIPVFWQDFFLDVRKQEVIQAVSQFSLGRGNIVQPTYTFNGLQRQITQGEDSTVQIRRDGLIVLNKRLHAARNAGGGQDFRPSEIDLTLRRFVTDSSVVYTAASIRGPFLISMMLRTVNNTQSLYPSVIPGAEESGGVVAAGDYRFPVMQADDLLDIDRITRPLCDQAHQMFGRDASPFFDADGVWRR
jgi:hypothetical protein